jgi:hypothetical protein
MMPAGTRLSNMGDFYAELWRCQVRLGSYRTWAKVEGVGEGANALSSAVQRR